MNTFEGLITSRLKESIRAKEEVLMAYVIQRKDIVFFMIGVHENFYKELKSYLKEVD